MWTKVFQKFKMKLNGRGYEVGVLFGNESIFQVGKTGLAKTIKTKHFYLRYWLI